MPNTDYISQRRFVVGIDINISELEEVSKLGIFMLGIGLLTDAIWMMACILYFRWLGGEGGGMSRLSRLSRLEMVLGGGLLK